MHHDITVRVTRYGDRKNWIAYYTDPVTERRITKSTKATTHGDAMRFAAKWEAELRAGRTADSNITWAEFRRRFEREKLPGLAEATEQSYGMAFNHIERLIAPKRLASLTAPVFSDFQAKLRAEGAAEATIASHLRHVKAALQWAVAMGFLAVPPKNSRPRRAGKTMKARAVVGEEFDRLIKAVPKIRPEDPERWRRFLRGLWRSGLRLTEALALSWDADSDLAVDLSGRHPRLVFQAAAQKSHKAELWPCPPEFAELLLATPEAERSGRVFHVGMEANRAGRIVAAIGKRANVVVDKASGKYASAHDLRRAFGTRWAKWYRRQSCGTPASRPRKPTTSICGATISATSCGSMETEPATRVSPPYPALRAREEGRPLLLRRSIARIRAARCCSGLAASYRCVIRYRNARFSRLVATSG